MKYIEFHYPVTKTNLSYTKAHEIKEFLFVHSNLLFEFNDIAVKPQFVSEQRSMSAEGIIKTTSQFKLCYSVKFKMPIKAFEIWILGHIFKNIKLTSETIDDIYVRQSILKSFFTNNKEMEQFTIDYLNILIKEKILCKAVEGLKINKWIIDYCPINTIYDLITKFNFVSILQNAFNSKFSKQKVNTIIYLVSLAESEQPNLIENINKNYSINYNNVWSNKKIEYPLINLDHIVNKCIENNTMDLFLSNKVLFIQNLQSQLEKTIDENFQLIKEIIETDLLPLNSGFITAKNNLNYTTRLYEALQEGYDNETIQNIICEQQIVFNSEFSFELLSTDQKNVILEKILYWKNKLVDRIKKIESNMAAFDFNVLYDEFINNEKYEQFLYIAEYFDFLLQSLPLSIDELYKTKEMLESNNDPISEQKIHALKIFINNFDLFSDPNTKNIMKAEVFEKIKILNELLDREENKLRRGLWRLKI